MNIVRITNFLLNFGYFIIVIMLIGVVLEMISCIRSGGTVKEALKKFDLVTSIFKDKTESGWAKLFKALCIISILYVVAFNVMKTDQIGSIFEKRDFTAQYYVYLYPDPNSTKCYHLPATITAEEDSSEGTYYRDYWVEDITFPNGHVIYFDRNDPAILNEKVHMADTDLKYYDIVLTNEKVKK